MAKVSQKWIKYMDKGKEIFRVEEKPLHPINEKIERLMAFELMNGVRVGKSDVIRAAIDFYYHHVTERMKKK